MKLTPAEFIAAATGNCLYVAGIPAPFLIVESGVASGNLWVCCPDEDFHVLAVGGLTLAKAGGTLTWTDTAGSAALVITPLASCEELSAGDAQHEIATAREYYKTTGAAWLAQQIAGAATAGPLALAWVAPSKEPSTF